MKKFILVNDLLAYAALQQAGFRQCGVYFPDNQTPIYSLFNSPDLEIPEGLAKHCVLTNDMTFALAGMY